MPQYYRDLVPWRASYLGGTCSACGTVSTPITPTAGATSALIRAEGGAIYWNLGGTALGAATATSPGYVAQDNQAYIPALDNLPIFNIIGGAAGSKAHIEFYQD